MFETYENRHNPHVTIHRDTCGRLRKRGGVHKYRQGHYKAHTTFVLALEYTEVDGPSSHSLLEEVGLPAKDDDTDSRTVLIRRPVEV